MKSRFSTIDITAVVRELLRFVSMRVTNVYDLDNKTYLIRLGKPDEKAVIVIESGIKIHSTEFDWPKSPAPSGFSMKMRKHLKGRRLESVKQLGVDRIVDLTFGSDEAAYHVILELYDRGNIVLTDFEYTILNILRPRTDNTQDQDVRFAVREKYPVDAAKQHEIPTVERLREIILAGKEGDNLKKLLIPHLDYGPAMIEHCLQIAGFPENVKVGRGFDISEDMQKLLVAIEEAESLLTILQSQNSKGYIIQKVEKRPVAKAGEATELLTYDEYHPYLFKQYEKRQYKELESFNKSVDEFYSQMESQKLELKVLQQEKQALKKLENIKKDHEHRVDSLQKEQETDRKKGELIEMNLDLVDRAILIVRSAIANQIDWTEIHNLVKEAQMDEDPVAMAIKDLKLDTNHIVLLLRDPYEDSDFEDDGSNEIKPMRVDIDLAISAYANSRKYFDKKKTAAVKEQKTTDASVKALKSAERKTKETLKEAATTASINKARKTYWFEKFLWFISSENFLVIGGHDQQQNELIVKRYLKQNDLYVHADLHGASSVIIKNHTGEPVPPKTLNEAGTMAICNSAAWDAKVVTSAWWVYPSQVSKTAPSGEYLTTGSFMIRGRKNYLPPSYLVYGFGLVFKLEEGSVANHLGERKVRTAEDDEVSIADSMATESEVTMETNSDSENEDIDSDNEADDHTKDDDKGEVRAGLEVDENRTNSESSEASDKITVTRDIIEDQGNTNSESTSDETNSTKSLTNITQENGGKTDTQESETIITVNQQCAFVPKVEFPDTEIGLQHISGDKYGLARLSSTQSEEDPEIYLGDDKPVVKGEKNVSAVPRISAKQRREMKKAKKRQLLGLTDNDTEDLEKEEEKEEEEERPADVKPERPVQNKPSPQPQQPPPKRGQKSKMKKIKEKYKDQDEEERELRMELLASAGSKKEDKKKKGKKGAEQKGEKGKPQTGKKQQQQKGPWKKMELVDIVIKEVGEISTDDAAVKPKVVAENEDEEKLEEDQQTITDDLQILNSLTGIPMVEDELLFAIPVCAPYNSLTNYKYKVKLLPGSTKRGKGAKLALHMFMQDKTITSREKDLLKTLKDADMSRNIPGKVKVTAPNITKIKRK